MWKDYCLHIALLKKFRELNYVILFEMCYIYFSSDDCAKNEIKSNQNTTCFMLGMKNQGKLKIFIVELFKNSVILKFFPA